MRRPRRRPSTLFAGAAVVLGLLATGAATYPQAAVSTPVSAADSAEADAVAGALAALRANAGALGFATDGAGAQGLGERHGVTVTDVLTDPDGSTHVRMDRSFAGLPVLGGDFVVHRTAEGAWDGASATLTATPAVDLVPALDATVARARALAAAAAGAVQGATVVGAPRLVVDGYTGAPALAWEVITTGTKEDGTPSHLRSYIDAVTGEVRFTDDDVHTADGEGNSLYLGRVPLKTTQVGDLFQLKDLSRGGGFTADAENRTDECLPVFLPVCTAMAPATQFEDKDNVWGSSSRLDRQSVAVDAQYGSNVTWDYFKDVHKRAGVAGDNVGVYSRVHYGDGFANAFWNDNCLCMTYGDGDGKVLGPLVSLDIIGHEISHGVTSRTAQLVNYGESGGLNEANSDIFGTLIEFYADNDKDEADYLIGETAFLSRKDADGKRNAIRFMDQPSKDGLSPDCYSQALGELGVHAAAGVGDHFFFLLAEGSRPVTINGVNYHSETCDGREMAGIGREAAGQIWYHSLTRYFTSGSGYAAARLATLRSAKELFGAGSAQERAVAKAWDAVNVVPADPAATPPQAEGLLPPLR